MNSRDDRPEGEVPVPVEDGASGPESCDVPFFDADRVREVRRALPPGPVLDRVAETFRALADPTRARILFCLQQAELCVHDLAHLLDISPSATSHQLRTLRNLRLVRYRKEGRIVYYSLDDEHIENLFAEAFRHVREEM